MFLNLSGNMIYYDAQDNPYTVDINQALINRSGQATSAMSYTGTVVVEINDSTHAIYNDLASYTGLYKENIYYHIIYANWLYTLQFAGYWIILAMHARLAQG